MSATPPPNRPTLGRRIALATSLAASLALGTSTASAQIGTRYCTANPNSTGAVSVISATGSLDITQNNVTLGCSQLPLSSFGFFIVSRTPGFVTNPGGSAGNLCVGGSIGRYSLSILNSGATGQVSLPINLTSIPHPTLPFAVQPGDTLRFQYWHRDGVPGGGATSNFSEGLEIGFAAAAPSFLNDIYPMFDTRNSFGFSCVDCHDGGTCGLDLSTPALAYSTTVGVSANCCPSETYFVPNDAVGSYIYNKLTAASPTCGNPMPLVGNFPGDVNVLRAWIEAGALNN